MVLFIEGYLLHFNVKLYNGIKRKQLKAIFQKSETHF